MVKYMTNPNPMLTRNNIFRFSLTLLTLLMLTACGNRRENDSEASDPASGSSSEGLTVSGEVHSFSKDADGFPLKIVYSAATDKKNCFFVISKVHPEHLSVYEAVGADTTLLAVYPVCIAKNKGQKTKTGDNKTPESYPGKPFYIQQIQDSSSWTHDFGDGRGPIAAYGHWFLRLCTPGFSGIGIHGSTGNRESVNAGRGSEGCIRLLDEDIIHLHDNYAVKGTRVIILPEDMGPLPFESRAALARF